MKGSRFIHCILVVALCLGQVVANVHVARHIGSSAEHASLHQSGIFDEFRIVHFGEEDSNPSTAESDCAAYHAYSGLASVTPAYCSAYIDRSSSSLVVDYPHTRVFAGVADTQPIRGPPTHS